MDCTDVPPATQMQEDSRPAKRGASPTDAGHLVKLPRTRTASTTSLPQSQPDDEPAQPPKQRIPPIILDPIKNWPVHALCMSQLVSGDFSATCDGRRYKITTGTVEHFRVLQRYLTQEKVPFFTFTLPKARPLKVCVTGLPVDISPEELHDELVAKRFAVGELKKLKTRGQTRNIWVIDVLADCERDQASTRPAKEIFSVTELFYVRIFIRAYSKPAGPPQCHRCQGFGHGSRNCGRPLKCVRCGQPHQAAQCTKEPGERGQCCNCGEQHNANYRGCQAYKHLLTKRADQARPAAQPAARQLGGTASQASGNGRQAPRTSAATPLAEGSGQPGASSSPGGDGQPQMPPLVQQQPPEKVVVEEAGSQETSYAEATKRRRRQARNPANRHPARPAPGQGQLSRSSQPSRPAEPPAQTCHPMSAQREISEPRMTASPPGFIQPRGESSNPQRSPQRQHSDLAHYPARPEAESRNGLFQGHQQSGAKNGPFQGHQPAAAPILDSDATALIRQVIDQLAAVTSILQNLAALITRQDA